MESQRETLARDFLAVRRLSLELTDGLEPDDFRVQPVAWVSPVWWTLGHTSWFFVKTVLEPFGGETDPDDERFAGILNSYYASFGARHRRDQRGFLTRPTTQQITENRGSVDGRVLTLISDLDGARLYDIREALTAALRHEQQHQELFLTELKYLGWLNPRPLREPYRVAELPPLAGPQRPLEFHWFEGGSTEIGRNPGFDWSWDIERPAHTVWVAPFRLASRTITNGEFLEFMLDGGYRNELLWLSNGWAAAQREGWRAPLYWEEVDTLWHEWTLTGFRPVRHDEPVTHISFYEADAFARWKALTDTRLRYRLPTEQEWEHAARTNAMSGEWNFAASGRLHPVPTRGRETAFFGNVWEWTASPFVVYPGYRPFPGPLGEYNWKFADGQYVLRGGSCATFEPIRISSRNFWPPDEQGRFQFTGIRLAADP